LQVRRFFCNVEECDQHIIRGVIATIFHRVLDLGGVIARNSCRPGARRRMLNELLAGSYVLAECDLRRLPDWVTGLASIVVIPASATGARSGN
jgi:fructose-specific phosphotransferase system IIC component